MMQQWSSNGITVQFDKQKTQNYRTQYNAPCECDDCQAYYEQVPNNAALSDFVSTFGVDLRCADEIFTWDSEQDGMLHYVAYYGVFGDIGEEGQILEQFGVSISFVKDANLNHDRQESCFWIVVEGDCWKPVKSTATVTFSPTFLFPQPKRKWYKARRIAAYLLDSVCIGILFILLLVLCSCVVYTPFQQPILFIVSVVIDALICAVIFTVRDIIGGGQSFWKRRFGLTVVNSDTGEQATTKQLLTRSLFTVLFLFNADVFVFLISNHTLSEQLSDTLVVDTTE